ncbi:MAG: hypothetical protein J0L97_02995 [Alphaproteobacteria bacterium]|nr:hypothetical protein [Alphaproteobacteria bacterium]
MSADTYEVEYRFLFEGGEEVCHRVTIDPATMISIPPEGEPPSWARLEYRPCDGCELKGCETCPVAVRIAPPLAALNGRVSHTPVTVTVHTKERDYVKATDLQEGLRSLLGLIMATSGCPALAPFRFMARQHLPFSTPEETVPRILSSYLLHQYFHHGNKGAIPFDPEAITRLYNGMQTVNEGLLRRLQHAFQGDASANAVVLFSSYSLLIPLMIEDELEKLRRLF